MGSWWSYFKGLNSFIFWPKSPKILLVAPDMCDYQNIYQIFDILFSLGIHRRNIKLRQKTGNFEVQMGLTFE